MRGLAKVLAVLAATTAMMVAAPTGQAAFPGKNGKIAFESEIVPRSGSRFLFTINPDGTELKSLLSERATEPAWSPDGTKIAFTIRDQEIAVVNADGSGRTTLTSSIDGSAAEPSWSPDGKKIAFTRFLPMRGYSEP
jgi:eukaryotic-like serine/threonine-protein kinase